MFILGMVVGGVLAFCGFLLGGAVAISAKDNQSSEDFDLR